MLAVTAIANLSPVELALRHSASLAWSAYYAIAGFEQACWDQETFAPLKKPSDPTK